MSWGYDATASLAPLNFNPAYSPAATNANLAALAQQQQAALSPQTLYGPGGFGAMTDYYSQLAANQLSALTPSTFAETPSPSGYDYGSLYGGGDAAAPPSAYDYNSLYGGGGGGGGVRGGGQADPFPGMAMPGGLNQPMALPSTGYDYGSLYGRGGGGQANPSPGMAMPGGLDQPMALPSTGYDYGSLYGGGGGAGNLGSRLAQALVGGDGGGGPFQSAFGAPSIGTSPGMGLNYGGFDNFGPGGGGGGANPFSPAASAGGGVYDPFNVGGQSDPALYGPGGLGGGGGIGQAPAAMPDLMRLLGYTPRQLSALPDRSGLDSSASGTPDVQGGIDSLQRTLDLIDRTTGGGYTLSPQDRDIPFRNPGGRSAGASPYADEGPYAGLGLPPEITQGGSIPNADPYPGFARSLFGDAPAYPSGVVRGPYELPDITPQQAQDPFSGGGPLPFTREDPFADFGLPPEITQGFSGRSAFGFDPSAFDQGFGNPRGFSGDPTFGFGLGFSGAEFDPQTFQSPANDYSTFQRQSFLPPWQASIPTGRNNPEVIDAVKSMATRLGVEPAEVAAMIQAETHDNPASLWNPQIPPNAYGYRGMTQMGPGTFTDAARMGMSIGGFPTIEDYQRGTAAQQIAAYGDWLDLYTRQKPQGAAALVNSGALAGLPPGTPAAIMQGAQFAPNVESWVRALERGDMNVPTTATSQAEELGPKTINSMTDAAVNRMARWPQQQIWSDYNMPQRPGGY